MTLTKLKKRSFLFANANTFALVCASFQNNCPFPNKIGFMPNDNGLNTFCLT